MHGPVLFLISWCLVEAFSRARLSWLFFYESLKLIVFTNVLSYYCLCNYDAFICACVCQKGGRRIRFYWSNCTARSFGEINWKIKETLFFFFLLFEMRLFLARALNYHYDCYDSLLSIYFLPHLSFYHRLSSISLSIYTNFPMFHCFFCYHIR